MSGKLKDTPQFGTVLAAPSITRPVANRKSSGGIVFTKGVRPGAAVNNLPVPVVGGKVASLGTVTVVAGGTYNLPSGKFLIIKSTGTSVYLQYYNYSTGQYEGVGNFGTSFFTVVTASGISRLYNAGTSDVTVYMYSMGEDVVF